MPKQKVRPSIETTIADKAVEPAPALCDDMPDDFMVIVRLTLNAVNRKLDNIVTLQSSMEKKLSDIYDRVIGQATTIAGLTESVEFNSANINMQQKSIDIVKK